MSEVHEVEEILRDRAKKYGDFEENSLRIAGIWRELGLMELSEKHPKYAYAFGMVVVKLVRLSVDPEDRDGWIDLMGYANLALELTKELDDVSS